MSLLDMHGITASYGASQALFGVDLNIDEGQVLALMGRNGMGKSTTIKVICRMLKNTGGTVSFAGQDISGLPTHKAARLGLGLVPEGRRCFSNLTVYENLYASAQPGVWDFAAVHALFPRLQERGDQFAASLSGGEQQMLAIGRALMTNPRLLILDEATEGLAPVVRQEIWSAIATLKQTGDLSILVVDKTLSELRQVADQVVILERGKSVWTGSIDALNTETTDRYLGI
ncbi:ABC transporter ATP-binding protein [Sulfitobacter sp. F26204]|uniref:ABC transporter ATP-binding protein n=1 Tax=Sulfitobacter sp. F26204 TaxID=2996014 RepID=UPI00225E4095|nr:ABC transporter ATP-binding protein [Sulfitobacter sp. F26204]MCX7561226.1 ABC transporter ATP-binding protein [Sulfitobacter sp. F26204]